MCRQPGMQWPFLTPMAAGYGGMALADMHFLPVWPRLRAQRRSTIAAMAETPINKSSTAASMAS